jgi:phosphatidylethanolamine-binding protein (PEBP) family uncharacterized protein
MLNNIQPPTRQALTAAMKGHIIEKTGLMGTYKKAK